MDHADNPSRLLDEGVSQDQTVDIENADENIREESQNDELSGSVNSASIPLQEATSVQYSSEDPLRPTQYVASEAVSACSGNKGSNENNGYITINKGTHMAACNKKGRKRPKFRTINKKTVYSSKTIQVKANSSTDEVVTDKNSEHNLSEESNKISASSFVSSDDFIDALDSSFSAQNINVQNKERELLVTEVNKSNLDPEISSNVEHVSNNQPKSEPTINCISDISKSSSQVSIASSYDSTRRSNYSQNKRKLHKTRGNKSRISNSGTSLKKVNKSQIEAELSDLKEHAENSNEGRSTRRKEITSRYSQGEGCTLQSSPQSKPAEDPTRNIVCYVNYDNDTSARSSDEDTGHTVEVNEGDMSVASRDLSSVGEDEASFIEELSDLLQSVSDASSSNQVKTPVDSYTRHKRTKHSRKKEKSFSSSGDASTSEHECYDAVVIANRELHYSTNKVIPNIISGSVFTPQLLSTGECIQTGSNSCNVVETRWNEDKIHSNSDDDDIHPLDHVSEISRSSQSSITSQYSSCTIKNTSEETFCRKSSFAPSSTVSNSDTNKTENITRRQGSNCDNSRQSLSLNGRHVVRSSSGELGNNKNVKCNSNPESNKYSENKGEASKQSATKENRCTNKTSVIRHTSPSETHGRASQNDSLESSVLPTKKTSQKDRLIDSNVQKSSSKLLSLKEQNEILLRARKTRSKCSAGNEESNLLVRSKGAKQEGMRSVSQRPPTFRTAIPKTKLHCYNSKTNSTQKRTPFMSKPTLQTVSNKNVKSDEQKNNAYAKTVPAEFQSNCSKLRNHSFSSSLQQTSKLTKENSTSPLKKISASKSTPQQRSTMSSKLVSPSSRHALSTVNSRSSTIKSNSDRKSSLGKTPPDRAKTTSIRQSSLKSNPSSGSKSVNSQTKISKCIPSNTKTTTKRVQTTIVKHKPNVKSTFTLEDKPITNTSQKSEKALKISQSKSCSRSNSLFSNEKSSIRREISLAPPSKRVQVTLVKHKPRLPSILIKKAIKTDSRLSVNHSQSASESSCANSTENTPRVASITNAKRVKTTIVKHTSNKATTPLTPSRPIKRTPPKLKTLITAPQVVQHFMSSNVKKDTHSSSTLSFAESNSTNQSPGRCVIRQKAIASHLARMAQTRSNRLKNTAANEIDKTYLTYRTKSRIQKKKPSNTCFKGTKKEDTNLVTTADFRTYDTKVKATVKNQEDKRKIASGHAKVQMSTETEESECSLGPQFSVYEQTLTRTEIDKTAYSYSNSKTEKRNSSVENRTSKSKPIPKSHSSTCSPSTNARCQHAMGSLKEKPPFSTYFSNSSGLNNNSGKRVRNHTSLSPKRVTQCIVSKVPRCNSHDPMPRSTSCTKPLVRRQCISRMEVEPTASPIKQTSRTSCPPKKKLVCNKINSQEIVVEGHVSRRQCVEEQTYNKMDHKKNVCETNKRHTMKVFEETDNQILTFGSRKRNTTTGIPLVRSDNRTRGLQLEQPPPPEELKCPSRKNSEIRSYSAERLNKLTENKAALFKPKANKIKKPVSAIERNSYPISSQHDSVIPRPLSVRSEPRDSSHRDKYSKDSYNPSRLKISESNESDISTNNGISFSSLDNKDSRVRLYFEELQKTKYVQHGNNSTSILLGQRKRSKSVDRRSNFECKQEQYMDHQIEYHASRQNKRGTSRDRQSNVEYSQEKYLDYQIKQQTTSHKKRGKSIDRGSNYGCTRDEYLDQQVEYHTTRHQTVFSKHNSVADIMESEYEDKISHKSHQQKVMFNSSCTFDVENSSGDDISQNTSQHIENSSCSSQENDIELTQNKYQTSPHSHVVSRQSIEKHSLNRSSSEDSLPSKTQCKSKNVKCTSLVEENPKAATEYKTCSHILPSVKREQKSKRSLYKDTEKLESSYTSDINCKSSASLDCMVINPSSRIQTNSNLKHKTTAESRPSRQTVPFVYRARITDDGITSLNPIVPFVLKGCLRKSVIQISTESNENVSERKKCKNRIDVIQTDKAKTVKHKSISSQTNLSAMLPISQYEFDSLNVGSTNQSAVSNLKLTRNDFKNKCIEEAPDIVNDNLIENDICIFPSLENIKQATPCPKRREIQNSVPETNETKLLSKTGPQLLAINTKPVTNNSSVIRSASKSSQLTTGCAGEPPLRRKREIRSESTHINVLENLDKKMFPLTVTGRVDCLASSKLEIDTILPTKEKVSLLSKSSGLRNSSKSRVINKHEVAETQVVECSGSTSLEISRKDTSKKKSSRISKTIRRPTVSLSKDLLKLSREKENCAATLPVDECAKLQREQVPPCADTNSSGVTSIHQNTTFSRSRSFGSCMDFLSRVSKYESNEKKATEGEKIRFRSLSSSSSINKHRPTQVYSMNFFIPKGLMSVLKESSLTHDVESVDVKLSSRPLENQMLPNENIKSNADLQTKSPKCVEAPDKLFVISKPAANLSLDGSHSKLIEETSDICPPLLKQRQVSVQGSKIKKHGHRRHKSVIFDIENDLKEHRTKNDSNELRTSKEDDANKDQIIVNSPVEASNLSVHKDVSVTAININQSNRIILNDQEELQKRSSQQSSRSSKERAKAERKASQSKREKRHKKRRKHEKDLQCNVLYSKNVSYDTENKPSFKVHARRLASKSHSQIDKLILDSNKYNFNEEREHYLKRKHREDKEKRHAHRIINQPEILCNSTLVNTNNTSTNNQRKLSQSQSIKRPLSSKTTSSSTQGRGTHKRSESRQTIVSVKIGSPFIIQTSQKHKSSRDETNDNASSKLSGKSEQINRSVPKILSKTFKEKLCGIPHEISNAVHTLKVSLPNKTVNINYTPYEVRTQNVDHLNHHSVSSHAHRQHRKRKSFDAQMLICSAKTNHRDYKSSNQEQGNKLDGKRSQRALCLFGWSSSDVGMGNGFRVPSNVHDSSKVTRDKDSRRDHGRSYTMHETPVSMTSASVKTNEPKPRSKTSIKKKREDVDDDRDSNNVGDGISTEEEIKKTMERRKHHKDKSTRKNSIRSSGEKTKSKTKLVVETDQLPVGGGLKEVLWALTQINVFNDGSRTYEVMKPVKTKPTNLPEETHNVFVMTSQKKIIITK